MSCVATACDGCRRAYLIEVRDLQAPACARCGAALRIVPGCSYATGDIELFDELGEAVAEARVSTGEARQLAAEIRQAMRGQGLVLTFEAISTRLPGLLPIQLVVRGNSSAQRRVLQMLRTILESLATSRHSGAGAVIGARTD